MGVSVRRRQKKPAKPPTIYLRKGSSSVNASALALLAQDGETHVLVYVRQGRILLSPICGEGLIGAVRIHKRQGGTGALLCLSAAQTETGHPVGARTCTWNDVEGCLEIEVNGET